MIKPQKKFSRKPLFLILVLGIIGIVYGISSERIHIEIPEVTAETAEEIVNYIEYSSTRKPLSDIDNFESPTKKNILFFSSSWCGSCLGIEKILLAQASEHEDITIWEFNLDTNREIALNLDVSLAPTIVFLNKDFPTITKKVETLDTDTLKTLVATFSKDGIRKIPTP